MSPKPLLITGASGFVGRALCAYPWAQHGYALHTVSRGELGAARPGTQHIHHRADLLDPLQSTALVEQLRPELVIHAAWYAEHGKFWNAPENLEWVAASLQLFAAFQRNGGRRFIGLGSCAEYDWSESADLQERGARCEPSTLYGAAKDATRRLFEAQANAAKLDWAWARVFMPFGPHEAAGRLLPSIALPLLAGRNARCSQGDQLRDFLHVDDLASAIACLALSDWQGPLNVASGQAMSVGDFAEQVALACDSGAVLERGALPMRPGDPERIVADVSGLRSLGFEPKFSLQRGVQSAVQSLRDAPHPGA